MKNLRAILLLFLANTVSGIAQGISMLAIPWYFVRQDDMAVFGWIYFLTNCLSFFWVPYAGTLIDKYNRKHVFLALNTIAGLIVLGVAVSGFAAGGLPWYIVGMVFMATFLNFNLHYPNLYAFVQEITEPRHYSKITSYLEIQGQLSRVLAGAFGALLLEGTVGEAINVFGFYIPIGMEIRPWEIHEIFLLDGATYFAAFMIIILIRYMPLKERVSESGSLRDRLQTGFLFLRRNPLIFLFGIASYGIFITALLDVFYLNALYVDNHLQLGGDVYASSEMYYSIGAIVSGIGVRFLLRKVTINQIIIVCTLFVALRFFVLAGTNYLLLFYLLALGYGVCNAGTRILRVTFLFEKVPNQVFGRTGSIFFMTNILFRNAFLLLFGLAFFQEGNNIVYAFIIVGIFLLFAALVLFYINPKLKEIPDA